MLVPVPLFDKYMTVELYLFRYQLANQSILFPTQKMSPPLEALDTIGAEAFTGGKPILVPVSVGMLADLAEECGQPPEIVTFLLEDLSDITGEHLHSMSLLRERGYRFAVVQADRFIDNDDLLKLTDFVLFDETAMENSDRRAMIIRYATFFKQIQVAAMGLDNNEAFEKAKKDNFHLYEGLFYRVPVTRGNQELTPIKANLIRLLNLVRDENFEFKDIAEVMRRDPALSYSLMRFINSPYLGIKYKVKSIQHAVTILGRLEVRKWITAAVFKALGSDRPNELTRISLVRAKFAENLAGIFGLQPDAPSLFLMGLFSVLDTMLDTTIALALEKVMVSDEIAAALVDHSGRLYPVMEYIIDYEKADWSAVIAHNMKQGLHTPEVYTAYLDALSWYNELLNEKIRHTKFPANPQPTMRSSW